MNEAATVRLQGNTVTVDASNNFTGSATVVGGTNTISVSATDASGNTRVNLYDVEIGTSTGTVTHDANGNLTAAGTKAYEWDAENRLVRVLDNSTEVASFTYNADGLRVTKSAGGVTHDFVYDGDDVLEDRTSGGTTRHIHGPAMDEHLATVTGGTPTYLLADHLGSIVQATDASAAVTLTRRYDPYGKLLAGDSTAGYAFTGREWDPETSLYYYRARYYDPVVGRFISEDPIEPQNFAYADNRPTTLTDPSGLMAVHDRIKVEHVDQSKIRPGAVASTELTRIFSCTCECVDGQYKLFGHLFLYGTMRLPIKVTRTPGVDKTVVDTASAEKHERSWHIDPAVAAVRAIVEPEEAKGFPSQSDCEKSCKNLKKKMPGLFSRTLQGTQDDENRRAKGGR